LEDLIKGAASAAPFSIRPVAASDIASIQAIYADAVLTGTATFELEPPDATEMERRRRALVEGGFPYLVAERDARLLGYAYVGPYRPRQAYGWTVENSVYLAANARRQGIGKALLAALVDDATEAGFRQMVAIIGDSTHHGSIRLHEAAGFEPVGTIRCVGWKHGRWLDTVIMQRPLGSGSRTPPGGRA